MAAANACHSTIGGHLAPHNMGRLYLKAVAFMDTYGRKSAACALSAHKKIPKIYLLGICNRQKSRASKKH